MAKMLIADDEALSLRSQMAPAMRAMRTDIARRWTVDALAREAHMSRSAFAAAFKAKTGDNPLGYLDSWRMYRAKALLRDTSLSLLQIASQITTRRVPH